MSNIVKMANDIASFHTSFPEDESVIMVAEHINKFWAPSLRNQFFELLYADANNFHPLVVASASFVRCDKHNPIDTSFVDKSGTGG